MGASNSDILRRPHCITKRKWKQWDFLMSQKQKYKWPSNRWPKDKKFKELGTLNLECSELHFSGRQNGQLTNNVTKACGCFKISSLG